MKDEAIHLLKKFYDNDNPRGARCWLSWTPFH